MEKMNEIFKVLAEHLRRSGISVTILCIGIWGVWDMRNTDIKELRVEISGMKEEHRRQTNELRVELNHCNADRERLSAKVAVMEIQIDFLTGARRPKTN